MVGQTLRACPVVDDNRAAFAVGETPVDDALAEGSSLCLHVPVTVAVGSEGTAVEDVDGARLADDLRFLTIEPGHFILVSLESLWDGHP